MSDKKRFTATVMTANVPGRNGNIFPRELLEKAVENVQEQVAAGNLYGGMNSTGRPELRNISHQITSLKMQGDDVVCSVAVLATEEGKKLHRLIEMGEAMFLNGLKNDITMVPMGTYKTEEDGTITKLNLTAINISDVQK